MKLHTAIALITTLLVPGYSFASEVEVGEKVLARYHEHESAMYVATVNKIVQDESKENAFELVFNFGSSAPGNIYFKSKNKNQFYRSVSELNSFSVGEQVKAWVYIPFHNDPRLTRVEIAEIFENGDYKVKLGRDMYQFTKVDDLEKLKN